MKKNLLAKIINDGPQLDFKRKNSYISQVFESRPTLLMSHDRTAQAHYPRREALRHMARHLAATPRSGFEKNYSLIK